MSVNSGNGPSGLSFVSETQIEERRKRRQEEWDKTRTDDMPLEAPEEAYDPRTLYERLKEQKDKKDEEWEESRKLKHLIKGLDNDEISFLEMVDNQKIQLETQRLKEEVDAIDEYKRAMSHLNNEDQEKRLNQFKKEFFAKSDSKDGSNKNTKKSSQSALMANLVRPKRKSEAEEDKSSKQAKTDDKCETSVRSSESDKSGEVSVQCIGVLPGLGDYDSSDSENSSSSDVERDTEFNLMVRHKRQALAQETKSQAAQHQH